MAHMRSPKKSRKFYDLEYKRRIVQEYLRGEITTNALAEREGLERGQIYRWKVQLAERSRDARVEIIADTEGVSLDQARKIRDLEEELAATQKKLVQLEVENELLGELVKKQIRAHRTREDRVRTPTSKSHWFDQKGVPSDRAVFVDIFTTSPRALARSGRNKMPICGTESSLCKRSIRA